MEMSIEFPVELENPHVIDSHQVLVAAVSKGPNGATLNSNYYNRDREDYKATLGNAVVNFARSVPQGLLIFFPSYPLMENCLTFWQEKQIYGRIEQYKQIYVEPRNKAEFQTAMTNFMGKINNKDHNGAIFVAVCRGKVSEGLDFADNNGRAVVITGLPYPPRMDARVQLKMEFLDEMKAKKSNVLTGSEWYRQQASRAVNQAVGRVIRHRYDYGAILLCDERFSQPAAVSQLSSWVQPRVVKHQNFGTVIRDVSGFFKKAESFIQKPAATLKRSQSDSSSGAAAAFFAPRSAKKRFKPDEKVKCIKASVVETHVPSLYRGPSRSSPSTSNGASFTPEQSMSGTQRKIKIKGISHMSAARKDKLLNAQDYVVQLKKRLCDENYTKFSAMLKAYKANSEYEAMTKTLLEIFPDPVEEGVMYRSFYQFVKNHHKMQFHEFCKEKTKMGCGYTDKTKPSTPQPCSSTST